MEQQKKKHRFIYKVGLTVVMGLQPVIAVSTWGGNIASAAEQKQGHITQEEAIKWAKQWIVIPNGYELDDASFDGEQENDYQSVSWRLSWVKDDDNRIHVTVDGVSGKLLRYHAYGEQTKQSHHVAITREQAAEIAKSFLNRVASQEEKIKLSKANEYENSVNNMYPTKQDYVFMFTRMEHGIPFLGDGYEIVVDQEGQVSNFRRTWYNGEVPEIKPVVKQEEAKNILSEKAIPSLVYEERTDSARAGKNESPYRLIYKYLESDPQLLDAATGQILSEQGKPVEAPATIQPLGMNTNHPLDSTRMVNKDEAANIAQRFIQKIPGNYRYDGSRGSGSSSGPDGVTTYDWNFEFTPVGPNASENKKVVIGIDDHGQMSEFRVGNSHFHGELNKPLERIVSWDEAKASSVKLVKMLMSDRLGDIYLRDVPPSETEQRAIKEEEGYYTVSYGWMKHGIPIEGESFEVLVNAETGEAVEINGLSPVDGWDSIKQVPKPIDHRQAVRAQQKEQQLQLTYYIGDTMKYYGILRNDAIQKPILVYRYIGNDGVVEAETGSWLSFAQLSQQAQAADIAGHPAEEALSAAIEEEYFVVADGKVQPDQLVTRAEFAGAILRFINQNNLDYRLEDRVVFLRDSDKQKRYDFSDLNEEHPQYRAIQQLLRLGVIKAPNHTFTPDRPITRIEAAEAAVAVLGYEELFQKREIFTAGYKDVTPTQQPIAMLAKGFTLFPNITGEQFEPKKDMTRAELAQLLYQLKEVVKE